MSKQSQTPETCYKQLYQLRSNITDLNETRIITSNLNKMRLYLIEVICAIYMFLKTGIIYFENNYSNHEHLLGV